jgi:hypothetical protein
VRACVRSVGLTFTCGVLQADAGTPEDLELFAPFKGHSSFVFKPLTKRVVRVAACDPAAIAADVDVHALSSFHEEVLYGNVELPGAWLGWRKGRHGRGPLPVRVRCSRVSYVRLHPLSLTGPPSPLRVPHSMSARSVFVVLACLLAYVHGNPCGLGLRWLGVAGRVGGGAHV